MKHDDFDAYRQRGRLRLSAGAVLSLRPVRAIRLRVLSGRAWVTQAGDCRDHFVHAGGLLPLAPRCQIVLQADGGDLVFALDARNAADGRFWQSLQRLLQHAGSGAAGKPGVAAQAATRG